MVPTSRQGANLPVSTRGANVPVFANAVAFDLDGTLLDTVHDLALAANAWLAEAGERTLSKQTIRSLIGKGIEDLVRRALALARGVAPESIARADLEAALARYHVHYAEVLGRETVVFPGVHEGLARMAAMGLPLAIVTNKASRYVRPHLERAGIATRFDIIIGGDDLPTKKPDAGPLRHVAARLGVATADLLMVGDSANDVLAARAAGCPVIVLPYGYSEGTPVDKLDADGIVATLAELADRIRPRAVRPG
jgi:phosphoglycolate phosphatase